LIYEKNSPPVPSKHVAVKEENIKVLKRAMLQVVQSDYGTGQLARVDFEKFAAKTGTAQWSSKYQNHAWLTAFAPYQNPQIVVTVLVEEGGEGSVAALPVAYEIMSWWTANR